MTQSFTEMSALYKRLSALGFPKKFILSKALPDWWDSEFEETAGAAVEAASYVSRRLNLDIASLLTPDATPAFKPSCQAKFKMSEGTNLEELRVAHCLASRVAEMVAYACKQELKPLPAEAQQVRNEILDAAKSNSAKPFVNLEGLLRFCWSSGIPVVYFDDFPKAPGVKKFNGLVSFYYNRPVIILSFHTLSSAKLLFILAHELGHIVKGHVNGTSIVDEDIKLENLDFEEIEANEFAVELLLGKPDMAYYTPRNLTGEELADYSQKISLRDGVDPGVVILNYGWSKANKSSKEDRNIAWATANKALKIVEPAINAPVVINNHLPRNLDWERLDEDSQDYLELVTAR